MKIIVSCNFQQKTELVIKIGFLDLRELPGARQNDNLLFTYQFKTLLQPVNAAYLLGKTQLF